MAEILRGTLYALCDPETEEVRYIGQTIHSVRSRYQRHLRAAKSGRVSYVGCWIRGLPEPPHLYVIERDCRDLNRAEREWIAFGRQYGWRLVNMTDGGDGAAGLKHTAETKAKMSAAWVGRVITAEWRANLSAANKGKKRTGDALARIQEVNRENWTGRKHSEETKAKIREIQLNRSPEWAEKVAVAARNRSDSWREKIGAQSKERWADPAYHARQVAARVGTTHTPEHRAKISAGVLEKRERLQQGGRTAGHLRWHVARGIVKPGCALCAEVEE